MVALWPTIGAVLGSASAFVIGMYSGLIVSFFLSKLGKLIIVIVGALILFGVVSVGTNLIPAINLAPLTNLFNSTSSVSLP